MTPRLAQNNVSKVLRTLYFPSCLGFSRHVQVSYARSLPRRIFLPLVISSRIPQCCKQEAALPWHEKVDSSAPGLECTQLTPPLVKAQAIAPPPWGHEHPQLLPNLEQKRSYELSPKQEVRKFPTAGQRSQGPSGPDYPASCHP